MPDAYYGCNPDFASKLKALLADCATRGVIMHPYFGLRDPVTQGKLWRQSRSTIEVTGKIASLKAAGALFLASCIEKAGPSNGQWATNAIPGYSWHQYGEAMDCYWLRNYATCWSETIDGDKNGYMVYGALAEKHGLTWIAKTMHKDFGHVQLRPQGAPDQLFGLLKIDGMMRDKFGPPPIKQETGGKPATNTATVSPPKAG